MFDQQKTSVEQSKVPPKTPTENITNPRSKPRQQNNNPTTHQKTPNR